MDVFEADFIAAHNMEATWQHNPFSLGQYQLPDPTAVRIKTTSCATGPAGTIR
jgi:hypothetical protein